MKEYLIDEKESGRRLDKFIMKILSKAPSSFVYKMLRKKNITLDDHKASGNEILKEGCSVKIYLSDETFDKFSAQKEELSDLCDLMPDIIYEDEDVLIVNKPSGMLSQRAKADDISLNEICLSYTNSKAENDHDISFTPSVCNRLDRNTSGLITFAKTYKGAKCLTKAFRDHTIGKFYRCICAGKVDDADLDGYLVKNASDNTVRILKSSDPKDRIMTNIRCVRSNNDVSLADIELITGKTHQIRAHLAANSHPIVGDPKYGDKKINDLYRKRYNIRSQMLVCYKMVIPDDFLLSSLAGKTIMIDLPDDFNKVL